mmetsp:Transcript_81088/g.235223  ORF Transcript_81088/g.235223 Transcript_81088/m.235223 type:complete len:770 (+) Transcript_81088:132-2441(+)
MRVRHLQTHLQEQALVHQGKLAKLRSARVGVDAVSWLRSIQALKDPFADALGGIPPGIFGFVDKELEAFRKHDITPLFVFQGVAPGPQHSMFVGRMDQEVEKAWYHLARGAKSEAQKCFAISTSRINGDFVYFIFHHLRSRGYECLQAPYFVGAQLAHFAEQGVVSAVFGPPGLLLYGVEKVIININFNQAFFEWVDFQTILTKWEISPNQFVDACMLAGTEYCLTYPYLNLGQYQPSQHGKFNFNDAVYIIKQHPLSTWMQHQNAMPEDMKNDLVNGYCICKVLVKNSPVLHLEDHSIRPLGAGQGARDAHGVRDAHSQVPSDFSQIMGEKLPNGLYYLMLMGIISHKLPQALAKGEWTDKSQPLVDTAEFRRLLTGSVDSETIGLQHYREMALGLIARHLHPVFKEKAVLCKAFWEKETIRRGLCGGGTNLPEARIIRPNIQGNLRWDIRRDAIEQEMRRQGVTRVDLKFCLEWHAYEFHQDSSQLLRGVTDPGYPTTSHDLNSLAALVHLIVLENLGYISGDGSMTVLGDALKDCPRHFVEPCLVAFEMLNFDVLSNEPFQPAQPEKPFPAKVGYPPEATPETGAILFLCRVTSLVPMKLKNDMWNADVDFDLAAFHSLVRILKRALRQLVEASLASVLLCDLQRASLLPNEFMCSSPKKEDHLQTLAVLPTFMLPRACMGIVVRHFLEYRGDPAEFSKVTSQKFPCCVQPIEDLQCAFAFWEEFRRCVDRAAEPLGIQELADSMVLPSQMLHAKQQELGIFPQSS